MSRMQWVWTVAWAVAAVAAAVGTLGPRSREVLDGGFRRPVLALEMAATVPAADAAAAVGGGPAKVRSGVYLDYGFIVFYVALFAALGRLLSREVPGPWCWLAVAAIACAVAAGGLDLLENARILKYVQALEGGAERADLLAPMRTASLLKWGAFFVAVALLAAPLWRAGGHLAALGGLFALVAALGAYGLAAHRPAIELAFTLALASAAPSAAAIWALWPRK